ncbi:sensor histidine kinase [Paenibacillus oceani]|uniref:histidine kinase n=1 Tax=Paenibacillus oceani TaxID=2772510 RepID=A0A927H4G5_9BACL|nr:histidine kinase [Paenibacillus oceani]MBD2866494.1 sensor histidine kinase [Paenibacillus oceani]
MRLLYAIRDAYRKSTQLRLTSYFMAILIPLVAVSLYANVQSQRILNEQVGERTLAALRSTMAHIDLTLQNIEELSVLTATDYNMNQQLRHQDVDSPAEATIDFQKVLFSLTNMNSVNTMLTQISIYHARSGLIFSSRYGVRRLEEYRNEAWYARTVEAGGDSVWMIPDRNTYVGGEREVDPIFNEDSVTLLRLMDQLDSPVRQNILMMTIGKEKFLNVIENLTASTPSSRVLLLDRYDNRIVGSDRDESIAEIRATENREGVMIKTGDDGDSLSMRVRSKTSGWSLVLVQPEKAIYAKSNKVREFTYLIAIVSVLLALLISWGVYRGIAAPLLKLAYGIKQIRLGNLNARLSANRPDEFGFLNRSFNEMAEEQQHLIENIYKQQLYTAKTDLKFLQSQINPHFLYNTLDSIYWTAKNYDAEEISEMVVHLSHFFRLSLGEGRDIFTVEETIEHLQYYLQVQQIRYTNHFSVKFDVDPETLQIPILKLLLQPLVENAILHGLEKKPEGGELYVGARIEGAYLRLEVRDDGVGIDPERLSFINGKLNKITYKDVLRVTNAGSESVDLYGLSNVKARVMLFYGEDARIRIESQEAAGTAVTIWIPLEKMHALAAGM